MEKKIIVGITGSIAAFKSVQLISDLVKKNYIIDVLMSESATQFITPMCIQSLTKRKVYVDTFDEDNPALITHIDIVKDADLFVIVPASAQTIAKVSYGMADNMLTSAFLAATCPKLIAPAMNVHMYENPITKENIERLKSYGVSFIDPSSGLLACGDIGKGKLAPQDDIMDMIDYLLSPKILQGKKVLINAGPTYEAIDPVRYITNHSSGKMGYALAKAAFDLGADVTLVSGPTHLRKPYGVSVIDITNANEMYQYMIDLAPKYDYIICAGAIGDYKSESISLEKIKKSDERMTLSFLKNKDILKEIGKQKQPHQIICGFAMETVDLIQNATKKLTEKNCDLIVANNLKVEGAGFNTDTNVVSIITKKEVKDYALQTKQELAYQILTLMKEMED